MTSAQDNGMERVADGTRLQMLVDAVIDYAIYMIDTDGRVASWNSGAARIKGYAASEIIGSNFSIFYTPEDRAAGTPQRGLETAARTGRFEAEGWRVRKDGSHFWASVVIDAIRDDTGTLVGFAKVTRDITERRNSLVALQETREQLAQAQRMEALGQLTGGVAHDFNNLLMIVLGNVRIIKRLLGDNERGTRAAEAIEHAARRGETLTRQLLTFSRKQRLEPRRVALQEWILSFSDVIASSLRTHLQFINMIPADIPAVKIDPAELELAILNLVVNARDAMPNGGTITVAAEAVTMTRDMFPGREIEGRFVALSVSDTGAGIPDDVLPKVFDPFFTTKPPGKGTGLGLSQVYGFAEQSHGTVTIDSSADKGTRITLYLPQDENSAEGEAHAPRLEQRAEGERTALLVEDDVEVAVLSAEMLEHLGYRVVSARTADEAMRIASATRLDLVFSDIKILGSTDGVALASAIRARLPDVPILLTTAYSSAVGPASRQFPILRKPFSFEDLSQAITRLVGPAAQANATTPH